MQSRLWVGASHLGQPAGRKTRKSVSPTSWAVGRVLLKQVTAEKGQQFNDGKLSLRSHVSALLNVESRDQATFGGLLCERSCFSSIPQSISRC